MIENRINNIAVKNKQINLLIPILFLWGLVIVSFLVLYWYESDFNTTYYLLPWCFLTGIVIVAPSAYLYYKNRFDAFNPIVFAAWSYFFPAFFIGGLALASGFSQPFFLNFIQDERNNLPLTFIYIILGYLGLTAGYFLPFGRKLGIKIGSWLPNWNWKPESVYKPSLLLLAIGLGNTILAFTFGILGFQKVEEIGAFDGLLFLLTLFWLEASCLLWIYIFRSKTLNINHYLIIGLLLIISLTRSAFQGNRGSLLQVFILVAFAYVASGRKIEFKQKIIGSVLILIAVVGGMIYGTTFRNIKTNQDRMDAEEYAGVVSETMEKVSDEDLAANLDTGLRALAERIDAVSSLAVIVSNYEMLKPYEEVYGIDNNIWKDSILFFIPRPLWADKPVAIDPKKYAELYFNYGENSFAMTPMGDLLRNFGPIGIPLGMIILGFILRVIYSSLIENQSFSFWRSTLFYMLLTAVSYEGAYSVIVPYVVRIGFISVIGLLIVWLFARRSKI